MADLPRRLQVSVDPNVFESLGLDPDESGGADVRDVLRRYARHLDSASRDAARILTPDEWRYLADAGNGTLWDFGRSLGTQLVATAEDAQDTDGLGAKWFGDADAAPRAVKSLAGKLGRMTEIQAEAVALAIRWAWDHADSVDLASDPWWTARFRGARAGA